MGAMRRNTELGLVILAAMITSGLYALASLGTNATMPADMIGFLAIVLSLMLVAHIATRRLAREADALLLPIALLLNGIGYVFIARLAEDIDTKSAKSLPGLQATWTFLGIGAYVLTLLVVRRVRDLDKYRYTVLLIGVALLLSPLVPGLGRMVNGSRIWISVGPISLQPGEFAKIALAVFFASYLVEKRELLRTGTYKFGPFRLPEPKYLAPVLLAWGVSLLVLIQQKDLGSSLLFFALFIAMVWVATGRVAYPLIGLMLFALGAYVSFTQFGHVQQRFDAWIDPWSDPRGGGYQLLQSMFAFVERRAHGLGPRHGPAHVDPLRRDRLHLRRDRRGARSARRHRHPRVVPVVRRVGPSSGRACHAAVPQAPRRRSHDAHRRAGLHHPRRGHAPRPAHRHHPAVRLLRRVVAARELRAARAPRSHVGRDVTPRVGRRAKPMWPQATPRR